MIRVLFFIRMTMSRTIQRICLFLFCLPVFGSCMKWDYGEMEDFSVSASGLFITNEGNFQYSNATLSYYDPATCEVENEVFYRANGFKLGDVAQSMVIRDGIGWIVVNNSHVIFAIDINTFKEVGRITGFTSPRYIHFLSDEKAYVTQIWDYRIFIINPKTYEITGYIECPDMDMESGSTEQMVQYGKYVYVNCWSYQNRILKIDTETDKVVDGTDHRHTTYFAGHGQIQQDVDHHGWRLRGQPIRLRGTVSLSYRRRDFHRRETVQV